ncbi:MAG: UDP-N-acetylglucosamine 2-epimerase (non-hydrolyzing) [Treponema sp.]|jgi:UDP-N-acetylglucosamine 2-epimerase (non-hydrolysing)|nr:UDP-N-acetylglucosamine 2-epimerase (non-hydrolyzing) [Treponema sp.]
MKKLLLVFGTRPEAIKMAPLVKEFQKYPDKFDVKVCVTAQHRQMLDQVLEVFEIKPDYDLNVMAPNQDLFDITSKVLLGVRTVLRKSKPDIIFVHGDTTTSMAAALAAFYEQIPIAHVEAGLRTYNLASPWPEEMNRQLTDRLCSYYFAPTESARENLLAEQIPPERIDVTGNTVIDALFLAADMIETQPGLDADLAGRLASAGYNPASKRPMVLVTGHRRESFGEGFRGICWALGELASRHRELDIVYPVHLNPQVQRPVYELLGKIGNIYLIPPQDYLPFVYLMQKSTLILTDSGGVQEEAPSLGKPVLVMRDTTERPEAVSAGTVKLVGTDPQVILAQAESLLYNEAAYQRMAQTLNPYGDGRAAARIAEATFKYTEPAWYEMPVAYGSV